MEKDDFRIFEIASSVSYSVRDTSKCSKLGSQFSVVELNAKKMSIWSTPYICFFYKIIRGKLSTFTIIWRLTRILNDNFRIVLKCRCTVISIFFSDISLWSNYSVSSKITSNDCFCKLFFVLMSNRWFTHFDAITCKCNFISTSIHAAMEVGI